MKKNLGLWGLVIFLLISTLSVSYLFFRMKQDNDTLHEKLENLESEIGKQNSDKDENEKLNYNYFAEDKVNVTLNGKSRKISYKYLYTDFLADGAPELIGKVEAHVYIDDVLVSNTDIVVDYVYSGETNYFNDYSKLKSNVVNSNDNDYLVLSLNEPFYMSDGREVLLIINDAGQLLKSIKTPYASGIIINDSERRNLYNGSQFYVGGNDIYYIEIDMDNIDFSSDEIKIKEYELTINNDKVERKLVKTYAGYGTGALGEVEW